MQPKRLSDLLHDIISLPISADKMIYGLNIDSRQIKTGELFIAYPGTNYDGREFIQQAITHGAAAILQEAANANTSNSDIPIINVTNLRDVTGIIAARFFNDPSHDLTICGVTGTNGKTSTTQFIARALNLAGIPCGVMGTLGVGFPDQLQPGALTTADAITLQHELYSLKNNGAKAVAMEVSSHSLDQNRTNGIKFNLGVFTNLTHDHLDYHASMENYAQAKRKLFLQPGIHYAVINADDEFGRQLIAEFANKLVVYAYTITKPLSHVPSIYAVDIKLDPQGLSATIHTPWGSGKLTSCLLGRFNLSNLLAAITVLCLLDIPLPQALHYLTNLPTVNGRMQAFGGGKLPLAVVDYSHTPDALEKALVALREHCHGKLWCVFGCGGNRDAGKRPIMGQIAEHYSDHVIITDDNPRFESAKKITTDILQGLKYPTAAVIEHDRSKAIAHAIDCAQAGDVILIAGKGHETYQQVGAEKRPFNDAQYVKQSLQKKQITLESNV